MIVAYFLGHPVEHEKKSTGNNE